MKSIRALLLAAAALMATNAAPADSAPPCPTAGAQEVRMQSLFEEGFGSCIRRELSLVMQDGSTPNTRRKGVRYPSFAIEQGGRRIPICTTPGLAAELKARFSRAGTRRMQVEVLGYESLECDGSPSTRHLADEDQPLPISSPCWQLRHIFVLLALPPQPATGNGIHIFFLTSHKKAIRIARASLGR